MERICNRKFISRKIKKKQFQNNRGNGFAVSVFFSSNLSYDVKNFFIIKDKKF